MKDTKETNEYRRLNEPHTTPIAPWRRWGPYVTERAWGTVREDYSHDGNAWGYLTYDMARANGAVGFLIAGPLPGHVVAGSSGREAGEGSPALGISPETAARLARRAAGRPSVTMTIETEEGPAETETLVYDYPGQTDEWVVLSAHVDGHDLAESAMDNGTGLASVLAVTRALAPKVASFRRGLRVMFFSVEEWALTGSAQA